MALSRRRLPAFLETAMSWYHSSSLERRVGSAGPRRKVGLMLQLRWSKEPSHKYGTMGKEKDIRPDCIRQ